MEMTNKIDELLARLDKCIGFTNGEGDIIRKSAAAIRELREGQEGHTEKQNVSTLEPVAWISTDGSDVGLNSHEGRTVPLYAAPIAPNAAQSQEHLACPSHCCPIHGCKYCYEDCPVANGKVQPEYPNNNGCEDCEIETAAVPSSDVVKDAERYHNVRHRSWLRKKIIATCSEAEWKEIYDAVVDQQIEDDAAIAASKKEE